MPMMLSKIREFVKIQEGNIILATGVIFVSLISFAVGYLVAKDQLNESIIIEKQISP